MRLAPGQHGRAAFTMIELVISSALMALIMVSAYVCLNAGVASRKVIEPRADIIQSARVALAMMSADLRSACPLSKGPPFLGTDRAAGESEADRVDFATHHFTPRKAGEGDYCEQSYFIERVPKSAGYTLWRRRHPGLNFDPLSGGTREEIATGLSGLRLEYYDGFDWYDTWGDPTGGARRDNSMRVQPNLSGLPSAVRITLFFAQGETSRNADPGTEPEAVDHPAPPLVFQTVARLELADVSQGGGGSGGGAPTQGAGPARRGGGS